VTRLDDEEHVMTKTRIRPAAALLALTLCAAPAPATAQERPQEFEGWTVPGWSFTPSLGIAGLWDSNIAVAAQGPANPSDRVFIVTPQGQLDFRSSRTEFVAGYGGDVRRYMTSDALNAFDQRAYISLRHAATPRLEVFARNRFDDVSTTDEIDLNGVPFSRFGAKTNTLAAGVDVRVTKLTDANVLYENTWVDFDNPGNFFQGGTIHSLRSDYSVRLSEKTRVGAQYRLRQSNINDDARTFWFHDMGGSLQQALSPHVNASLAAGYSLVRDPGETGNRGGLYLKAGIDRRTDYATVGVSYERSYAPSFGFGGSSSSQELRGNIFMPFTRNRLYVNASGGWRRTNPLLRDELELDTFIIDTAAGYGITRWARVEAFHRFSRQDSEITGGEINRHRVGLQVVISQPMRIQ
jgi:hypothetical protein